MNRWHFGRKKIASDDDLPAEKWVVAYRNPASKKHPGGSVFLRQFYAPGFYEAYDTVLTHAESMNLELLWFREKRSCADFINCNFPELDWLCIYCNKKFNDKEPLPCVYEACKAELCSKKCLSDHLAVRHKVKDKSDNA
jgi:hypothetical protein